MPERKLIELPDAPCPSCHGRRFWYRKVPGGPGDWLCARCHPPANDKDIPFINLGTGEDKTQVRERMRRMVEIMKDNGGI